MAAIVSPSGGHTAGNRTTEAIVFEHIRLDVQVTKEVENEADIPKVAKELEALGHPIIPSGKKAVKYSLIQNTDTQVRARIQARVDSKGAGGQIIGVWNQPDSLTQPLRGIAIPLQQKGVRRQYEVSHAENWEKLFPKVSTWNENPHAKEGEHVVMVSTPISNGIVIEEMIHGVAQKRTQFEFRTLKEETPKVAYVVAKSLPVAPPASQTIRDIATIRIEKAPQPKNPAPPEPQVPVGDASAPATPIQQVAQEPALPGYNNMGVGKCCWECGESIESLHAVTDHKVKFCTHCGARLPNK